VKVRAWLTALGLAAAAAPVSAGPPYLTDDPVPTDPGHWEIYSFAAGEGRHSTLDEDAGLDLNYGPVTNLQLTATLPLSFSHAPLEGWRSGTGDLELGAKYRFFHDQARGLSASIFPRAILPTATHSPGEKARFLLPVWVGKDFRGGTSLFGGGGYLINPGAGNRNFWQAALALTHDLSKDVSVGAELTRQGPESVGATSQTRAGAGAVVHIAGPASLLVSGGPTWSDHRTGYHFYAALGLDL
jgi:Putative MetA-pathway of phenol degradation